MYNVKRGKPARYLRVAVSWETILDIYSENMLSTVT
jgi:hypothetical protein